METLQLMNSLAYSRKWIWLSNKFLVQPSILRDELHSNLFIWDYKYGGSVLRLLQWI